MEFGFLSHVYHLFVIRTLKRQELIAYLESKNIGWFIHYPIPPHKQQALSEFVDYRLPIAEMIHETILSIPSGLHLSDSEVEQVANALRSF